MIFIGEKIDGIRKVMAQAIRARDTAFIQDLVKSQAEVGSSYFMVMSFMFFVLISNL